MYRRNYPNDPGFAESIAAAARQEQRQQQQQRWARTWDLRRAGLGLVSLALLAAGCFVGFWIEGRAVARDRVLYEGMEHVVSLPAAEFHSPEYEGRLVHVAGKLDVSGWCRDPEFGLSRRVYRMKRIVETYQWIEERVEREVVQSDGSSRTETISEYRTVWQPGLVDSSAFSEPSGHRNPRAAAHVDLDASADGVSLGAFRLADAFLDRFGPEKPLLNLGLSESQLEELAHRGYRWLDGFLYSNSGGRGGGVYNAQVGDVRIRWTYGGAAGDIVTVIGRQTGLTLAAFDPGDGDAVSSIALLQEGYRTPRQMFAADLARSRLWLWAGRAVAFLLLLLGCAVFRAGPLDAATLAAETPRLFRQLLALPTSTQVVCAAGCASLAVTALAWLRHRPLTGFCLLAACCAVPVVACLGGAVARRRRGWRRWWWSPRPGGVGIAS